MRNWLGENYLIVGAQVLTGCLGPGATLVVTKFYRFQVSGSGCLRTSFHLAAAPLYSRKGEHYGLEYILQDRIVVYERRSLRLSSELSSEEILNMLRSSIIISLLFFSR